MNTLRKKTARLALFCLASLTLLRSAAAEKITVWMDDAHTRQIQVEKLDPDEIADPSSFSLGLGAGVGQIGISIGYSREAGVQYDEQVEALIEKVQKLCEEFNAGKLSLESYQGRIRQLFASIEAARLVRLELSVHTSLAANKAGARLDKLLGLPAADNAAFEERVTAAMGKFRSLAESIPPDDLADPGQGHIFDDSNTGELERSRRAVQERLGDLKASLRAKPLPHKHGKKLVEIWKDKARTIRIVVPALDVEGLVKEFSASLSVQMKYSPPLISVGVGAEITWTLETRAKYDQAAQLLIIKYRKLCLEYNGGLISQAGYFDRLVELMEAEQRAFAAREKMTERLNERADAMRKLLDKQLGGQPSSLAADLRERAKKKSDVVKELERSKRGPSAVGKISEQHREEMDAWDAFVASVGEVHIDPPTDTIEVFVDDTHTRKVSATKLDTDIIAQSVKTRLSLHITFFNLGPECAWAKEKGLEYGRTAQMVIVKSKQLAMDYNSELVSQESFVHTSRQIDRSIEYAAEVREGLIDFYTELKDEARNKLDRRLRMPRGGARPDDD